MADDKIPFDYLGAKKAGYSDQEIQGYLKQNYNFDFDITGAKGSGYSDKDIADYITAYEAATYSKKKVGSDESQYTFPTTVSEVLSTGRRKTPEDEKNKFIKPLPPQTFQQGLQKDKLEYSFQPEKKGSALGGVYNTVVDAVGKIFGGAAETVNLIQDASDQLNEAILGPDTGQGSMVRTKDPSRREQLTREQVTNFIDKARTASSTKKDEEARSQFDITDGLQKEDVEALAFLAPKTIGELFAGAMSGGTTFFLSSVNDNAKELKESGADKLLSPAERLGIVGVLGTTQAVIEKFGIDKVLKSTGLSNKLKHKIANEVTDELVKRGVKATTQEIEKLTLQKVSKLSSQINRIGVKAATSFLTEAGTEITQTATDAGLKLLANKVTDKKVFNEKDITTNFVKNVINAGAMGGAFGGAIGGGVGVLSNTKKALRNQIAQAQSPQDVAKIHQDINQQVELGNITPEEAEAANITAQQYAEIAAKIPGEVDSEKKYALIGGIEQREDLTREIENAAQEMAATDPAFHKDIEARAELLNAKLEQTNDYIDGLVTGKKTTYKKQGDEFFKTDAEGNQIPISKLHYELATAIREQDALNNKKPEINPTDQKTFTFEKEEDVPKELENVTPIAIRETEDGKVEATYSGEQLVKAGLATKPKELTEVGAAKLLAKIPSLNDIDQAMADEDPIGMVKFIAEQANGGREEDMIKQGFPKEVIDEAVKQFPPTAQQTKASPTTEVATKEVLNLPKNFKDIQDTDVEVRNSDGTKTKTKFKRAFVDLKKQFKQLDNVLKCI